LAAVDGVFDVSQGETFGLTVPGRRPASPVGVLRWTRDRIAGEEINAVKRRV
jgi:hypothetical protein